MIAAITPADPPRNLTGEYVYLSVYGSRVAIMPKEDGERARNLINTAWKEEINPWREAISQGLRSNGQVLRNDEDPDMALSKLLMEFTKKILDPSISRGADELYNRGLEAGIKNCPAASISEFMDKHPALVAQLLLVVGLQKKSPSEFIYQWIEMMEQ